MYTPTSEQQGMKKSAHPIRVMVVDDSAVLRGIFTKLLNAETDIEVVASAFNGERAIAQLKQGEVDVIVLDIEMPVMDGLTAIPKLLEIDKDVIILMASTLTEKNAAISLEAMSLGAADYLAKPSSSLVQSSSSVDDFKLALIERVRTLGQVAQKRRGGRTALSAAQNLTTSSASASSAGTRPATEAYDTVSVLERIQKAARKAQAKPEIISIGSSTGGPQALFDLFKGLKPLNIKQPIVITQHMPETFTKILADHIRKQVDIECKEAAEGDIIEGGKVYIAPGGSHLIFKKLNGQLIAHLTKTDPVNFCRPSVDVMLDSLIEHYGSRVLSVILTGMGNDGQFASERLHAKGGIIIAQDKASSVVWGMPGAVAEANICDAILPLTDIPKAIKEVAG